MKKLHFRIKKTTKTLWKTKTVDIYLLQFKRFWGWEFLIGDDKLVEPFESESEAIHRVAELYPKRKYIKHETTYV